MPDDFRNRTGVLCLENSGSRSVLLEKASGGGGRPAPCGLRACGPAEETKTRPVLLVGFTYGGSNCMQCKGLLVSASTGGRPQASSRRRQRLWPVPLGRKDAALRATRPGLAPGDGAEQLHRCHCQAAGAAIHAWKEQRPIACFCRTAGCTVETRHKNGSAHIAWRAFPPQQAPGSSMLTRRLDLSGEEGPCTRAHGTRIGSCSSKTFPAAISPPKREGVLWHTLAKCLVLGFMSKRGLQRETPCGPAEKPWLDHGTRLSSPACWGTPERWAIESFRCWYASVRRRALEWADQTKRPLQHRTNLDSYEA